MTRLEAHTRQVGISLVELLVAMMIGLILVLAISQLFLGSKSSFRSHDEAVRLQENMRFALDMLTRQVRLAGFDVMNAKTASFNGQPAISGVNDGGLNDSDSVTVRFTGMDNAAGDGADGSIVDCFGAALRSPAGGAVNDFETERFYIAADAANGNVPTLYCERTLPDGTIQANPLVGGVESMQILYGRDTNADAVADRWTAWQAGITDVVAARISLVLRTPGELGADTETRKFNHFGFSYASSDAAPGTDAGAVFTPGADKRLRTMASVTVALRNRLE